MLRKSFSNIYIVTSIVALYFLWYNSLPKGNSCCENKQSVFSEDSTREIIDFEGFDNQNESALRPTIVPNIVHLIFLENNKLRFHEMVCIFSIFLNQKPDTILIHCENCSFHGVYWEKIEKVKALRKLIRFNQIPVRRSIFGLQGSYSIHHRFFMSYLFCFNINLFHL